VNRAVHPIEARSYRLLRGEVDTSGLPPRTRDVVERVIHTTADPTWLDDLVADEAALERGALALREGAPLIVDAHMVAAGITAYPTVCLVREPETRRLAEEIGLTRSAAAISIAVERYPSGAVWAIGNAPTALVELLSSTVNPALVIGVPVGYVGAADAKRALRDSGLPALSNRSARGGSPIAAATVNALLYGDPLP
jgi:precorrin-8X/cobalt-precorrin-8 methylmutase